MQLVMSQVIPLLKIPKDLPIQTLSIEFSVSYLCIVVNQFLKFRSERDDGLFNELERLGVPLAKNTRYLRLDFSNTEPTVMTTESYLI